MSADRLPIRGLVEGFYGVFYTFPERDNLIRFLGEHGFNMYLYAPKNDRQHRARWREPYPAKIMAQFAATAALAAQTGVDFCYGISPGGSIRYSLDEDFDCLSSKLSDFHRIGVRSFALLLDDLSAGFVHPQDAAAFSSPAGAQAAFANRLFRHLKSLDPQARLLVCPGEYYGAAPFNPSLIELARGLDPEIYLFYTGPEICSPVVTAADASAFAQAAGRAPILWDNYPVNDLAMQPELHLLGITGREPGLLDRIGGILINPMIQAEASKIPLLTYAAFLAHPHSYNPRQAWTSAAVEIAGPENVDALSILADCAQVSNLQPGRRSALFGISQATLLAVRSAADLDTSPAILELEDYLTQIDEACYALKFRLDNLALRDNLLPWIELLEHWMWMTRRGLTVLRSQRDGLPFADALASLKEYKELIERHPKRLAAQSLMPIADYVIEQAEHAPVTPVGFDEPARKPLFRLPQLWSPNLKRFNPSFKEVMGRHGYPRTFATQKQR